jgi:hypothetical protein
MNRCRSSNNDVPKSDVVGEFVDEIESPLSDDDEKDELSADLIIIGGGRT